MPIDSSDLMQLAHELAPGSVEVRHRASISRAHYASFHRCQVWELELPLAGDDLHARGSHERLIARLRHPHRACDRIVADCSRELDARLETQKTHRAFADYRVDRRLPRHLVEDQLKLTEEVLKMCDARQPRHVPAAQPRPSANR